MNIVLDIDRHIGRVLYESPIRGRDLAHLRRHRVEGKREGETKEARKRTSSRQTTFLAPSQTVDMHVVGIKHLG